MTALTSEKSTPNRGAAPLIAEVEIGVKAATKCIQGGLAVNDAGALAPGRTALGLVCLGFFEKTVDNTSGGAGAVTAKAVAGTRKVVNSAGADEIVVADIGKDCFIVDDATVAKTDGGGTRSRAGKVAGVDADGVWVLASANLGPDAMPKVQRLTGTLAAGILAITSGFSLTATSTILPHRINGAGTQGDELRVPSIDRTVGAPGVAAITVRSFLNGGAATLDTSTFELIIIG